MAASPWLSRLTSKMSHGYGWRGSCAARDVTDMAVGSGALLGLFFMSHQHDGARRGIKCKERCNPSSDIRLSDPRPNAPPNSGDGETAIRDIERPQHIDKL